YLDGSGAAVTASVTNNVVICGSTGDDGIHLQNILDTRISHNITRGCGKGINAATSGRLQVEGNNISGGASGLALVASNSSVRDNMASSNSGAGISVTGDGNAILYNAASNNTSNGISVIGNNNSLRFNTTNQNGGPGIFINSPLGSNTIDSNF